MVNDRLKFWTTANQPDIRCRMETNNYVESWHNQLKTVYLQRQPNRRVDRLIFILVKDVAPHYDSNIKRIVSCIERMGPMHYEERRRFIAAESVLSECLNDKLSFTTVMNDIVSSSEVQSLTRDNVSHTITVTDHRMERCTCASFGEYDNLACKHMHLARRLRPELPLPIRSGEFSVP